MTFLYDYTLALVVGSVVMFL